MRYQPLGPLLSGEGSRAFLGLRISAGAPPLPITLVWVPNEVVKDPEAAAKLARETKRAASLEHPNIIRVHGLASLDEGLARVVEFADGESLRTILNHCGKLPPRLAALVTADAAMGAHYAHVAGNDDGSPLVHGDIRPETLLVSFTGVCKVAGYGALSVAPREQGGKRVQGRRNHCAPEQVLGGRDAINRQTDVYLLGLVLYECLAGIVPFQGDPDFDQAVLNRPFPPLPEDVPPDLIRVVEQATKKKASERYATSRALRDAIERAVGVLPAHEELAACLRKYYPEDSPARIARRTEIELGIAELSIRAAEHSRAARPPEEAASQGRRARPRRERSIATYVLGTLLLLGVGAYWFSDRGAASSSELASAPSAQKSTPPGDQGSGAPALAAPATSTAAQVDLVAPTAAPSPADNDSTPVQVAVAPAAEPGAVPTSSSVVSAGFSPEEERTSLELTVEPAVNVAIDGRSAGRSPIALPLPPGKHLLRLVDGSRGINASREIQVAVKGKTRQHVVLGKGLVEVTAPDGAVISIDGKAVGTAPLKEISVFEGKHRIQAMLGSAKWQQAFSLGANERMFFNIETTSDP